MHTPSYSLADIDRDERESARRDEDAESERRLGAPDSVWEADADEWRHRGGGS